MSGNKSEVKKLSKKHRSRSVGLGEVFKDNQIGKTKVNRKVLKKSSAQNSHRGNASSRLTDKIEDDTIRSQSAQSPRLKPTELLTSRTRSASPQPLFSSPRCGNFGNFQVKKFHAYYFKILDQLENMAKTADDKPEEPDSLVDLHRQRKRANEFAVRFSRNHLYQMKRQLGEIKRMLMALDNLSKTESANLYKNVLLACQTGSQGLQNYINYMSIPQSAEVPEKIKELIILLKELILCCEHLSIPLERTEDFMKLCTGLLIAYDFKIEFEESKTPKKKIHKSESKENTESNKYSMYKAKLMNSNWKKQTEALAKIKFGLPPYLNKKRAKRKDDKKARATCDIYTQKMHPKCGKYFGNKFVKFDPMKLGENEKNENPPDKKAFQRKKYGTPREVTSHDEDIDTIVQSIMDDEEGIVRKSSSIISSSDESIHLEKSQLKDALTEAFQKLQTTEKEEVKASLKRILKSICHQRKQSQESLAPNVKVYHIKSNDFNNVDDNDNKIERVEDELGTDNNVDLVQTFKEQKEKDLECARERKLNVIFKPIAAKKSEGKNLERDAVAKGKIKLTIPEETVDNLTKYRKAFKNYCKNNIMYKKDAARRPWDLVATIADKLIDDVLAEISYGMEDETVLQRLYYNELLTAV